MLSKPALILLAAAILTAAPKRAVTLDDVVKTPTERPTATWSPDGARYVFEEAKKLYLYDCATQTRRELLPLSRLTDAAAKPPATDVPFDWTNRRVNEHPIQWFQSATKLLVAHSGDLFVIHLDDPKSPFDQLTHTPEDEADPKLSPDNRFVSFRRAHNLYTLEIATGQTTQLTRDGSPTLLNAELDWVYPEELDLSTAHWWSPDSRHIAYLQFDTSREPIFPHVSLLTPNAAYEPQRFPKSGNPNATVRLGVIDTKGGLTKWMDLGDPASHLLARVTWLPDSSAVSAIRLNRIQNQLDLLAADPTTGAARTLIHEDDAFWITVLDEPFFLPDGAHFLWESERTGFRHLYLYNLSGKLAGPVTTGKWEVTSLLGASPDGRTFYYSSTEAGPLERHLYRINLDGSGETKLTTTPGVHDIHLAPNASRYLDTFSDVANPPETTLHSIDGKQLAVFTPADRVASASLDLSTPELTTIVTKDGTTLYARLTKPVPFDPARKYPVIVNVYGGPDVQTILNHWTGVGPDQLLAAHGFIVWSLDNRGSSHRGHAFESVVHKHLGKQELSDQLEGLDYLKKLPWVDASRIGITGASYGGFMTLYSLTHSDAFAAGFSVAPVTDWLNYDTIYTERYMGMPDDNKDGYKSSAIIPAVANLKGKLLLAHNIEDDNVHFANTMQLADALERADKPFRMIVYPQRTHGITGPVRRNYLTAMLDFFTETLQPQPR